MTETKRKQVPVQSTAKKTQLEKGRQSSPEIIAISPDDIRQDVAREDQNVQYHFATTLPVQGFMIAALMVLLLGTKEHVARDLAVIRDFAPLGISLIGLIVSLAGLLGIVAARKALGKAIGKWDALSEAEKAGRSSPYGGTTLHRLGGFSAYTVGIVMPLFWLAVLIVLTKY